MLSVLPSSSFDFSLRSPVSVFDADADYFDLVSKLDMVSDQLASVSDEINSINLLDSFINSAKPSESDISFFANLLQNEICFSSPVDFTSDAPLPPVDDIIEEVFVTISPAPSPINDDIVDEVFIKIVDNFLPSDSVSDALSFANDGVSDAHSPVNDDVISAPLLKSNDVSDALSPQRHNVFHTILQGSNDVFDALVQKSDHVFDLLLRKNDEVSDALSAQSDKVSVALSEQRDEVSDALSEQRDEIFDASLLQRNEIFDAPLLQRDDVSDTFLPQTDPETELNLLEKLFSLRRKYRMEIDGQSETDGQSESEDADESVDICDSQTYFAGNVDVPELKEEELGDKEEELGDKEEELGDKEEELGDETAKVMDECDDVNIVRDMRDPDSISNVFSFSQWLPRVRTLRSNGQVVPFRQNISLKESTSEELLEHISYIEAFNFGHNNRAIRIGVFKGEIINELVERSSRGKKKKIGETYDEVRTIMVSKLSNRRFQHYRSLAAIKDILNLDVYEYRCNLQDLFERAPAILREFRKMAIADLQICGSATSVSRSKKAVPAVVRSVATPSVATPSVAARKKNAPPPPKRPRTKCCPSKLPV